MIKRLRCLATIALICVFAGSAISQEIKGDTIYVSASQPVSLQFPSPIQSSDFDSDKAYTDLAKRVETSTIILVAKNDKGAPTTLLVKEGNRTHSFIILTKQNLAPSETEHKWNTIELLKQYVSTTSYGGKKNNIPVAEDYDAIFLRSYDLLAKQDYAGAKKLYDRATALKEKRFKDEMNAGNRAITSKNYDEAIKRFTAALVIKPGDPPAKKKLADAQQKSTSTAKLTADSAFKAPIEKQPEVVKTTLPKATVPDTVSKVGPTLNKTDEDYRKQIEAADLAYNQKNYTAALGGYKKALTIKNDQYASTRITELNALISQPPAKSSKTSGMVIGRAVPAGNTTSGGIRVYLGKAPVVAASAATQTAPPPVEEVLPADPGEENDEYSQTLSKAAIALRKFQYQSSLDLYKKASILKPEEVYPSKMIRYVEAAMEKQSEQQKVVDELERKASIIRLTNLGNDAVFNKKWDSAKYYYQNALALNPDKSVAGFAAQKIAAIDIQLQKIAILNAPKKDTVVAAVPLTKKELKAKRKLDERNAIVAEALRKDSIAKQEAAMQKQAEIARQQVVPPVQKKAPDEAAEKKILEDKQIREEADANKRRQDEQDKLDRQLAKQRLDDEKEKKRIADQEQAALKSRQEAAERQRKKEESEAALRLQREEEQRKKQQAAGVKSAPPVTTTTPPNTTTTPPNTTTNPPVTTANPPVTTANPTVTTANPPVITTTPPVSANNPPVTTTIPPVTTTNPPVTATKPTVANINTLPAVMQAKPFSPFQKFSDSSSYQKEALPYSRPVLLKKYPLIDFDAMPAGQPVDTSDRENRATHFQFSRHVMSMPQKLSISEIAEDVKVTVQGIYFNGPNAYIRINIQNNGIDDFLTGIMSLTLIRENGKLRKLNQRYISDFPVVAPGKQFSIVYVAEALNVAGANDIYILELDDRSRNTSFVLHIPGDVYSGQRNM